MAISAQLEQLVDLLCGEFSNQAQAMESPTWFVGLRLWQRRLPSPGHEGAFSPESAFGPNGVTLFLEQANHLKLDQPYRQRLLRLFEDEGQCYGQYYQLKDFSAWRGAGAQPERLQRLRPEDVADLPGCRVSIASHGSESQPDYRAVLIPGGRCEFEYDGKLHQVIVGFDVAKPDIAKTKPAVCLKTYDKGVDPDTGKGLWGALMGPYEFVKLS